MNQRIQRQEHIAEPDKIEAILLEGMQSFYETKPISWLHDIYLMHKLRDMGHKRLAKEVEDLVMGSQALSPDHGNLLNISIHSRRSQEYKGAHLVGYFRDFLALRGAQEVDSVEPEYQEEQRLAFLRFITKENPEFASVLWNDLLA